MKMSEERNNIIKAMIKVQTALKPIKKDRENNFANGHKYSTLDAILEAALPILSANDIFLSQEPETTLLDNNYILISVTTHFLHSSGEYIEYEPLSFQLEKGAKMNLAQSSGSVITYIKRYSLTAALGISSGDDTDGNLPQQNEQYDSKKNHPVSNVKRATDQQKTMVKELIKEASSLYKRNEKTFEAQTLAHFKCDGNFDEISQEMCQNITTYLKNGISKLKATKEQVPVQWGKK